MTQQGFSKLRGKFNHRPFELMLRGLVSEQYSGRHTLETWHGLYLFAVDGSYLQLPNTADVRERLGTRGRGKQCACAGASVLFDVLNGWALNPILTHSDMNERVECGEHIDFIGENLSHIAKNSLLLLDRGYPSGPLLESLEKAELYYLIRCSSNFHSPVNKAGLGSTAVKLAGGQSIRVYKFVLPNGDVETLLTNLFDTPDPELALLYGKRWGIETLYTKLKNIVCVENFSGRTPNTVLQDFWASMVLLNSVAVFQKEADELVTTNNQGKKLKHKYRARTSDMVVTLRDRFVFCLPLRGQGPRRQGDGGCDQDTGFFHFSCPPRSLLPPSSRFQAEV